MPFLWPYTETVKARQAAYAKDREEYAAARAERIAAQHRAQWLADEIYKHDRLREMTPLARDAMAIGTEDT